MTNIDYEQQFDEDTENVNTSSSKYSDEEINNNDNLEQDNEDTDSDPDEVVLHEDDVIGSIGNNPNQEIENLIRERDDARDSYTRALADYQNFQRRSIQNENRARTQAKAGLMRDILPALDHLELALSHEQNTQGNDALVSLVHGLSIVRDEFLRAFAAHDVVRIEVKPGDDFNPVCHEAMMHVENENIDPGKIAQMLQPGYVIDEIVIRPAKISLAKAAADKNNIKNHSDNENLLNKEK